MEAKYQAELEAEMSGKTFEEVQETKATTKPAKKRKVEEPKAPGAGSMYQIARLILQEILLSKKQRKLYNQLSSKEEAKKSRVNKLMNKRKTIEETKSQETVGKTKK